MKWTIRQVGKTITTIVNENGGLVAAIENPVYVQMIALVPEYLSTLQSVQQRVHQAHHEGEPALCTRGVCADILGLLARAEWRRS